MAKLSQRAMNNVVIFAMLIMIALFNIDSFMSDTPKKETVPLLPQDNYLLKIEQGESRLERAGQGWRQVSSDPEIEITPEAQLAAWRNAKMVPLVDYALEDNSEPLIAVVWMAGKSSGQVYAFYPDQKATLIRTDERWYRLHNATLSDLLPWHH